MKHFSRIDSQANEENKVQCSRIIMRLLIYFVCSLNRVKQHCLCMIDVCPCYRLHNPSHSAVWKHSDPGLRRLLRGELQTCLLVPRQTKGRPLAVRLAGNDPNDKSVSDLMGVVSRMAGQLSDWSCGPVVDHIQRHQLLQ